MKKKMIPLLLLLPLLFLLAVYGKDSKKAEIIKDGINGFLSDNDVTAFANRLRYILERHEKMAFMGGGFHRLGGHRRNDDSGV